MRIKDMSSNVRVLWLVAGITLIALLPALFVPTQLSRPVAALLLAVAAGAALTLIRKRRIPSLYYRQVAGLLIVAAAVYLMLSYLLIMQFGYYRNYPALSLVTFGLHILPAAVIIAATELIRSALLTHKGFLITLVTYILCILSELLLGRGVSQMGSMTGFLDTVGMTLLPALTSNLFYNYVSRRYGALPNIAYRLVLSLTVSFLPVVPAIPDALNSFALLVLPLILWIFISMLYEKRNKQPRSKRAILSTVGTLLSVLVSVVLVMLISCEFRYGMIVISTPSMRGTIEVGDATLYETYEDQLILEDDIIVFSQGENGAKIIHRVVEIQNINGETRYYTQGDANPERDPGYLTDGDIRGVYICKIPYVGEASLWFRDLFAQ